MFFVFKQKTAYELRISDWSSDVCSSDLGGPCPGRSGRGSCARGRLRATAVGCGSTAAGTTAAAAAAAAHGWAGVRRSSCRGRRRDRKSVVEGKSVSVRVAPGGRRIIKTKKNQHS